MPIGTLTKKIQCQPTISVRTPPRISPMEAPAAPTKLNAPMALACSRGSRNRVTIMPRLTAVTIAPPMPWANRAAISIAGPTDSPHSSDATVKAASPARNMRLRPMRSPRRPASSSKLPNAIR